MSKFSSRVAVHTDEGPVWFNAGDAVPDWAADLVGGHCIVPSPEVAPAADEVPNFTGAAQDAEDGPDGDNEGEPEGDGDEDAPEVAPAADEVPDFTAPAPRRGRPRKA